MHSLAEPEPDLPMNRQTKTAIFAAVVAAVIIGLIAGMFYIDSFGESERPGATALRDAADR